jgi:hypothetical protein
MFQLKTIEINWNIVIAKTCLLWCCLFNTDNGITSDVSRMIIMIILISVSAIKMFQLFSIEINWNIFIAKTCLLWCCLYWTNNIITNNVTRMIIMIILRSFFSNKNVSFEINWNQLKHFDCKDMFIMMLFVQYKQHHNRQCHKNDHNDHSYIVFQQ